MIIALPKLIGIDGTKIRIASTIRRISPSHFISRSLFVLFRSRTTPSLFLKLPMDSRNVRIIIGSDLIRDMIPPAATAPAPMYLT